MALNARNIKRPNPEGFVVQEPLDAGSYPARVVQVLDLGVQPQRPYKGNPKPPCQEVMVTYEFLDEFIKDEDGEDVEDKPRWLSETFPLKGLDVDLATSTKRYNVLDPEEVHEGDFTALIDIACTVNVVNNPGKGENAGKVYNNIAGIAAMRPKDARNAAALVNPPKVLVLDEPDMEVFLSLPDWLQEKIKANLEYVGSALEEAVGAHLAGGGVKDAQPPKPAKKPAKKAAKEPAEGEEEGEDGEPW
jgi:hypothetical protein